ncbi:dCTP deaminase domain-containing protein [Pseudomonas syringae]|uniref:dCTP deaminase domain-containing protein n=1 Tax=Pseudomonas syringae TaxID=317 RepID=UPI0009B0B8AB|nr:deoxycytidine deaminase [Pseudomonas syringae]
MVVIDTGLAQLTDQFSICDKKLVDDFSLKIEMSDSYYEPLLQSSSVVYGRYPDPKKLFSERMTVKQNLKLEPGGCIITCSRHKYQMPLDYFGLVQTKGTLARMFVQATCNDGQVEPGFNGYITLEIVNLSPWTVEIPVGSEIAQLYLLRCSSLAPMAYHGRYSEVALEGPTIPIFKERG